MITETYLDRLRARRDSRSLRDAVIFGLTAGWLLLIAGVLEAFTVVGASEPFWEVVAGAGAVTLLATIVYPHAVQPVAGAARAAGVFISGLLFRVVLALVYLLMILPAGLWLRSRRGSHPFYSWTKVPPVDAEGWMPKTIPHERIPQSSRRASAFGEAASTVNYFIAIRSYIYLPVLIALIALGFILFVVQTSALAPFIYTLF